MIVVRSKPKRGRTEVFKNEIRKLLGKNKILLIDATNNQDELEFLTDYVLISNMFEVEGFLKQESNYYNYFALSLNVPEWEIKIYKKMEIEYNIGIILTVQEHADSKNEEVLVQVI